MLSFDIAGAQIEGARDYQEDAFLITHLGETDGEPNSLLIVADGMGGHAAGNVASNMAVQTFNKHLTSNFPANDLASVLEEAVHNANHSITETVRETAALKGMGCTLVAAVVAGDTLNWVSVGDSHLYVVRDGVLQKKNADHSYGGFLDRMAEQGTPVEAESGFSRNMLMSALTGDDIADVDCPETGLTLNPDDILILASDGLDTLSEGQILESASKATSARDCVDVLLADVEEAGLPKQDNTTIIVVCVGRKETEEEKIAAKAATFQSTAPSVTPNVTRPPAAPAKPRFERSKPPAKRKQKKKGMLPLVLLILFVAGAGGGAYYYLTEMKAPLDIVDADLPDDFDEPIDEPFDDPEEDPEDPGVDERELAPAMTEVEVAPTFRDQSTAGVLPLMATLPDGEFVMGSRESSVDFTEQPPRQVAIKSFAIGVSEVSIAEYSAFAAATGRRVARSNSGSTASSPVAFVSWEDAVAYAKWLSRMTGKRYRLPTEAEWEYAARAGTTTNYWWGRDLTSGQAHCVACENNLDPRAPTKIASFPANPFGLFDTQGNVQEWVSDCYRNNYEGAPVDGTAVIVDACNERVVRGGSYSSGPRSLRTAARDKLPPSTRNDFTGFRIARDL